MPVQISLQFKLQITSSVPFSPLSSKITLFVTDSHYKALAELTFAMYKSGRLWTCDSPASVAQVLGLQVYVDTCLYGLLYLEV